MATRGQGGTLGWGLTLAVAMGTGKWGGRRDMAPPLGWGRGCHAGPVAMATRQPQAQVSPKGSLCVPPPLCPRSIVHLCLRKADQKLVILKQIPVEQMSKDERLAAQNECQVLKLLSHPNVIEYYENFLEDKALMIAMEYAPGAPRSPLEPVTAPGDTEHSARHGSICCGLTLSSRTPQDYKRGLLEQIRPL